MAIAPPPSLKQFEDWAEDHFTQIGSGTDMVINPPRRDRRGWDYIAEWDVPERPGLSRDLQLKARTARVQVKSNRQRKPVAKVSLTNCLRFSEAVDPCFIVLYWLNKQRNEVWIYAKHFGDGLVARTLQRAREAEYQGRADLHNIDLLIPMDESELHTDDLTDWIKDQCKELPATYATQKAHHHKNVGYDENNVTGSIKFAQEDVVSLIESAVGLPTKFNPKWIDLRDTRFGIPAVEPIFEGQPTDFQINATPRPATVIFKSPSGVEVKFDGEVRSFSLPGYEQPGMLIASFISTSIVGRFYNDRRIEMNYSLKAPEEYDARHLQSVLRLFLSFKERVSNVTIIVDKGRLDTLPFKINEIVKDEGLFEWADSILSALIGHIKRADSPRVSLAQLLNNSENVEYFARCISPGITTLKITVVEDRKGGVPDFTGMLAYAYAEIGSFTYAVFYKKRILSQSMVGGKLVAKFHDTEILDAWAKPGPSASNLPKIRKRFTQLRKRAPEGTLYAYEGDMIEASVRHPDIDAAGALQDLRVT